MLKNTTQEPTETGKLQQAYVAKFYIEPMSKCRSVDVKTHFYPWIERPLLHYRSTTMLANHPKQHADKLCSTVTHSCI